MSRDALIRHRLGLLPATTWPWRDLAAAAILAVAIGSVYALLWMLQP